MYLKLASVMAESGMWHGEKRKTHAFLLSPDVYEISHAQRRELTELGYALYDCMMGLSHIAAITYDRCFNYKSHWLFVRRVFSSGVPKIYQQTQGINPRDIPQLLKLDLMVDQSGNFKIAEIDGHNKHGIGYSTIGMRLRKALYPDAESLPGTVCALASDIRRLGYQYRGVTILYSDQERFYEPEFEVARQEFKRHDISCRVISETSADEADMKDGLLLDLPFLNRRPELYDPILSGYKAGTVHFIIPPKPFLGAKGVLALLRNDADDVGLEGLLNTFIHQKSLALVRKYIPETLLVGKQGKSMPTLLKHLNEKRYVLKESISSGMKGTVFSDDPEFESALRMATSTHLNWILQEEVVNRPQTFSWYETDPREEIVLRTEGGWFMRVTVQYVNRTLADIIVTARRDKAVHGAKDCLQLGTIII